MPRAARLPICRDMDTPEPPSPSPLAPLGCAPHPPPKRKRGAPLGNRNALKHGRTTHEALARLAHVRAVMRWWRALMRRIASTIRLVKHMLRMERMAYAAYVRARKIAKAKNNSAWPTGHSVIPCARRIPRLDQGGTAQHGTHIVALEWPKAGWRRRTSGRGACATAAGAPSSEGSPRRPAPSSASARWPSAHRGSPWPIARRAAGSPAVAPA